MPAARVQGDSRIGGAFIEPFAFDPSQLFINNIQGAWYDPSDNATMFQDAAGLTPVTAVEQPVGSILDKRATAYSNAFNGTSSYINTTLGQSINIATDAFCVEAWCNITSVTNFCLFSTAGGVEFYLNEYAGTVYLGDGTINNVAFSSSALPINTWFHIAVTFDGAAYRVFVNGTLVGSSLTLLANSSFNSVSVGARPSLPSFTSGRISNFRVVKGSAVYTSNFTPPTAPLAPIAGTILLTCGVQWAGNPALTNQGATVSGLNPFAPTLSGNHAYQSTAASRPVLRARYNLLTYSEQFDNAAWFKEGGAVSANSTLSPDGTTTADTWTASGTNNRHAMLGGAGSGVPSVANADYVFSAYVKKGTHNYVSLLVTNNLTTWFVATFDLSGSTPVMSQSGAGAGGTFVSSSVESAANGFWRLSIRGRKTDAVVVPEIALSPSATPTYGNYGETSWAAAGTETIVIWGAQLLTAADVTATGNAYQRIVDAATYATGGVFRPYLAFDGVDDRLQTASTNIASNAVSLFAGHSIQTAGGWGSIVTSGVAGGGGVFLMISDTTGAAAYQIVRSEGTLGSQVNSSTFAYPYLDVWTMQAQISTDTLIARRDGAQTATSSSDQGSGSYASNIMYVGSYNGANWHYPGRIYGLIVRGAASSATEVAQTESWLNQRTGAY